MVTPTFLLQSVEARDVTMVATCQEHVRAFRVVSKEIILPACLRLKVVIPCPVCVGLLFSFLARDALWRRALHVQLISGIFSSLIPNKWAKAIWYHIYKTVPIHFLTDESSQTHHKPLALTATLTQHLQGSGTQNTSHHPHGHSLTHYNNWLIIGNYYYLYHQTYY